MSKFITVMEADKPGTALGFAIDEAYSMPIDTFKMAFPNAQGLKYLSPESNVWRLVTVENGRFYIPENNVNQNLVHIVHRSNGPESNPVPIVHSQQVPSSAPDRQDTPPLAPRRSLWSYIKCIIYGPDLGENMYKKVQ